MVNLIKKFLFILLISFFLFGCSNKDEEIQKLMKENDYIIVDVRTEEEYNDFHLADAINLPYNKIDENVELDKDKLIFVYCQSGNRSSIAHDTLTNLGYNVYDLGAFKKINLPKE